MSPMYALLITPLLAAATMCLMVALFVWGRRPAPGAVALTVVMVATAAYSLSVSLGLASQDLPTALGAWRATFAAAAFVWPAWLVFAVEYTGHRRWLRWRYLLLLFLVPLATLVLVATNERHHLVNLGFYAVGHGATSRYGWTPGPAFFVYLAYSDACALAGTCLLAYWATQLPRSQRMPVAWLLFGAAAPLLGRVASQLAGGSPGVTDLSPFVLPISGLAWAYGLLRFGLYGVLPVARESMFHTAKNGLLILDVLGRVADANPAAQELLGVDGQAMIGRTLRSVIPQLPADTDLSIPGGREYTVAVPGREGERTLEVRLTPVYARNRRFSGHSVTIYDVTDVHQALEALDRANRESLDILSSISDGFVALDGDLRVTYLNKAAEALLAHPAEALLGQRILEVFPVLATEDVQQAYAAAAAEHRSFTFERYLGVEGYRNWYEVRVYPRAQGASVYFRVTTEQRQAAEALRASEEKFRAVVEQSQNGIQLSDAEGRVIEWNAAQEAITGLKREEVIGRPLWELQGRLYAGAGGDAARNAAMVRFRAAFGQAVAGAWPSTPHEARLRRPDGTISYMQSIVFRIHTSAGALVASVNRDVTELREAEQQRAALYRIAQAAIESDDLQQLFGVIHEAVAGLIPAPNFHIALYDGDTGYVSFPYLVDADCPAGPPRRNGRGRAEYIMRTKRPLLADSAELAALVAAGEIESEGTGAASYLGVPLWGRTGVIGVMAAQSHRDGEPYTETHRELLMVISGQVAMAIERKRAEEALRRSEAQLSTILNGMAAGVAIIAEHACRYANPALEEITGYTARELAGDGFRVVVDAPDWDALQARDAAGQAGRTAAAQFELQVVRKDGERRWLAIVVTPIEFEGGPALLVSALDMTEQKRLQEQVIASQKLSTLGTMAAGVAHEINSPLQVITGMAQTLADRLRNGHVEQVRMLRGLDLIERNGWRCAEIVGSLLTYARPSSPQSVPEDLNAIVRDALLLVEHQLRSSADISVETHLAEGLPPLVCDHNQIVQVLINLLTNARDAMPDGGTIVVSTGREQPGGRITLQVADAGVGMAESVRARIFDPFFTTKEPGKGTGLGLSIVSSIVRARGGEIEVASVPGQGSRFTLYFPPELAPERAVSLAEEGGRYDPDDGHQHTAAS